MQKHTRCHVLFLKIYNCPCNQCYVVAGAQLVGFFALPGQQLLTGLQVGLRFVHVCFFLCTFWVGKRINTSSVFFENVNR